MRLLGLIAVGAVGLLALGGLSRGGSDGITHGNGAVGAVTGDGSPLAQERLALTIGGGYAIAKGGSACLAKGVKACLGKPGGGSGGGGGAAEPTAKGKRDDGESATKDTTPPTAPPQQPPAPAPPQPTPQPKEPEGEDQAATNPLGRTQIFPASPRPGDRGQTDLGGTNRSDLLIPMPGVVRN